MKRRGKKRREKRRKQNLRVKEMERLLTPPPHRELMQLQQERFSRQWMDLLDNIALTTLKAGFVTHETKGAPEGLEAAPAREAPETCAEDGVSVGAPIK